MDTLKKYALPLIAVVVVFYLLTRLSKGGGQSSTSTINRLVPLQGENNTSQVQRDQARVQGFQALAGVAQSQIAAEAQDKQLAYGVNVENIKAGLQRELGLQNFRAIIRQIEGNEEAYRIESADRRYDIDQQMIASQRMLQAQENFASIQARSALDTLLAQIDAVQSVGQQYRGQSLERQGTILNALGGIWNQPRVYDYQTAFGGPRPPTFLQQLGGFIGQAGSTIRGFW